MHWSPVPTREPGLWEEVSGYYASIKGFLPIREERFFQWSHKDVGIFINQGHACLLSLRGDYIYFSFLEHQFLLQMLKWSFNITQTDEIG